MFWSPSGLRYPTSSYHDRWAERYDGSIASKTRSFNALLNVL
jgi:hypothetical protein